MERFRLVDGVKIPLSAEEASERDAALRAWTTSGLSTSLANSHREERNNLLAATDWSQASDVPQAIKDKYAAYRQALRDVPQQVGFPDNIQWPTKPE